MARHNLEIEFSLPEIIYDVENKTYLSGRVRVAENPQMAANIQVSSDDENHNQVLRSIGQAFYTLGSYLSEYMTHANGVDTLTNQLYGKTTSNGKEVEATGDSLVLSLPSNYNVANNHAVVELCHAYIVNSAIADWFIITSPNDAQIYIQKAASALKDLLDTINRRVVPVRTPLTN